MEAFVNSLTTAIEQSAEAIVVTDASGRIQYVNPAFTLMTGYGAEEGIGQTLDMLQPGGLDNRNYEDLWNTLRDGRRWCGELISQRKDGTPYHEGVTVTPVRDAAGSVVSYIVIKHYVTDRRAAGEARRFVSSIVESTQDAVIGRTPEGTIMTCNRGAEELFGYRKEELVGRPVSMLMPPESWDTVRQMTDRLKVGEIPPFEVVVLVKNGRRVQVQVSLCGMKNAAGEITAIGAIVRDITERSRIEQALRDSEVRFRTAFDHAPLGMCLTSMNYEILHANATFCRMLGYTEEEMIERGCIGITYPDDQNITRENYRRLLLDRPPSVDFEKRYIRKDGTLIPARVRTSILKTGRDLSWEFITHIEDITEQKRTRERIQSSLLEKEALLREIHHRVKNNLQIVCSLLKLNSQGLHDPEALHVIEDTRHRVKAMALVHETLYRSGDLAGINFSQYIPRLAEQLLHSYGLSRSRVTVSQDVNSLILPIDTAIPCALILTELISNSAKHALVPAGGGELRISFRLDDQLSWLVRVEDSGTAEPAPAADGHPSSFGLELVRLLTEQLEGTMHIEHTPGFCVSVLFPLAIGMEDQHHSGVVA